VIVEESPRVGLGSGKPDVSIRNPNGRILSLSSTNFSSQSLDLLGSGFLKLARYPLRATRVDYPCLALATAVPWRNSLEPELCDEVASPCSAADEAPERSITGVSVSGFGAARESLLVPIQKRFK
jgi:hypothetical protein